MQKVEGSNPFSRFQKAMHLQAFFVGAVDLCVWDIPLYEDAAPAATNAVVTSAGMSLWLMVPSFR
jgi:hypothetical protein